MARQAKILDRRVLPSSKPDRRGLMDVVITYQAPTGGVYPLILPEEASDLAAVTAAIKADVAARDSLTSAPIALD